MSVKHPVSWTTSVLLCLTPISAALITLFSALVLIGWASNSLRLARISARFIPMAPATALCFAVLASVMLSRQWRSGDRHIRRIGRVLAGGVLCLNAALLVQFAIVLVTNLPLDIEQWFTPATLSEQGYIIGRMSPVAALLFGLLSSALLLSLPVRQADRVRDHVAQSAAAVVLVLASILVVGYGYGTPLLYGGTVTPVALTTAIGFILLSGGLLLEGARAWLFRWMTSASILSRFTRLVIPGTVVIILLAGWQHLTIMAQTPTAYDVLSFSLSALFSAGLVTVLTVVAARHVQATVTRAEQSLRESEAKYRLVVENMNAGVFQSTLTGTFLQMNSTVAEMAGYGNVDELMPKPATCLYADLADRERLKEMLLRQGQVRNVELRSVKKDGTQYWISMNAVLQRDEDGKPDKILGIVNDITERKRAEVALRESEERANAILRQMLDGFWVANTQGRIVEVNDAMCRMVGYTCDEMLSMSVAAVEADDPPEVIAQRIQLVIQSGSARFESRFRRKDGQVLDVDVSVTYLPERNSFFAFHRDITERKQVEAALREREALYRALVEASPDAITLIDLEGRILACNQQTAAVHGYDSVKDMLGRNLTELFAPEEWLHAAEDAIQVLQTGSSKNIGYTLLRKDGVRFAGEVSTALIRDEAGRPKTFVGISRDITERKQTEEALRRSEQAFRQLFEQGTDGILIIVQGHIIQANRAFCAIHGLPVEQVVGMNPLDLIHPEDRAIAAQRIRAIQAGEPASEYHVYRALRQDGQILYVEVRSELIDWEGMKALQTVVRDTTDRKRAEEALRESEERFRIIFEHANDAIHLDAADDQILQVNPRMCELMGYSREELLTMRISDLQAPEVREQPGHVIRNELARHGSAAFEGLNLHRSGLRIPVEISVARIESAQGDLYVSIVRDITERKRAEEALRESEQRLNAIIENAGAGYFRIGRDGCFEHVNAAWLRLHGYDALDQIVGQHFALTQVDMDLDAVRRIVASLLEDASVSSGEFSRRCRDGSIGYHTFSINAVRQAGQVVGLEGFLIDTTERKRAEGALRASEEKFRSLFDNAEVGMFRTRLDGSEILDMNETFLAIFGRTREEMQGAPSVIHWADPLERQEMVRRLEAQGRVTDFECGMLNKQGEVRRCLTSLRLYREQGILEGSILDITERKQAEEALRATMTKLETLIRVSPLAILMLDTEGRLQLWNPAAERILGWMAQEVIGHPNPSVPAAHRDEYALWGNQVLQGNSVASRETVRQRKDGTFIDVSVSSAPLYDDRGKVTGRMAIVADITERKRAEEKIRRHAEQLAMVADIEHSLAAFLDQRAIYASLAQGLYRLVPDAAAVFLSAFDAEREMITAVYGLNEGEVMDVAALPELPLAPPGQGTQSQVIRTRQPLIIASSLKDNVKNSVVRIGAPDRDTQSAVYVPMLAQDKVLGLIQLQSYTPDRFTDDDVRLLSLVANTAAVALQNARLYELAQTEIADRKRAELRLTSALDEKETLLRELYHRTKNNMQVIISLLRLQAADVADTHLRAILKDTQNRIHSMALVHQRLYQSQNLSRINLDEYLRELAHLLLSSYQTRPDQIEVSIEAEPVPVLIDTAIPCGLLLNELISNALKHAFPAGRSGEIKIWLGRAEGGEIVFGVADNGVGAPPGFDFRQSETLGVTLIWTLAQQLQGQVTFESNGGVVCQVKFKDNLYEPRV